MRVVDAEYSPVSNDQEDRRRALQAVLLLLAASACFFTLAIRQAVIDSPTFDEPINVAAGVTYLTRHDIRVNIEHPPLAKAIEAIPVLFAHPSIPQGDAWDHAPYSSLAYDFYTQNLDQIQTITMLSRLPGILMAIGVAWVLYAIGAHLVSRRAGLIGGLAWLTTPLILGHGHLAGLDVPLALVVALGALAVVRYVEQQTTTRAVLVGLCGGAALLTRTTGLVVVPALALAVGLADGWRPSRRTARHAGAVVLVAWVTLWCGYRAISPHPSAQIDVISHQLVSCPGCDRSKSFIDVALDHLAVPLEFRVGVHIQGIFGSVDHGGFIFGHQVLGHTWWFWPASLLIKLSLPATFLVIASLFAVRAMKHRRQFLLGVAVPAGVLGLATLFQAPPVGVRYLLPVIALTFVGGGVVVDRLLDTRWPVALVLPLVLILGQLVSLGDAADHSVAWTTWPFRPAYRYVADSNLDWAQDLDALRPWAAAHHPLVMFQSPIIVSSPIVGSAPLLSANPAEIRGWVAVGESSLDVYKRDELAWLRGYCPVGTIGGTILLYNFERPPDLRPAGEQPVGPCFHDEFSHRLG